MPENEGAQDDNENSDDSDKENQGAENEISSGKTKNSTKSNTAVKEKTHYDLRQRSAKGKSFRRRYDRIHFQFLQMQRDIEQGEICPSTGLKVANFIQAQIMLTQMCAKRGIKLYGDKAISAIVKEFSQLDDLDVFQPMYSKQLTKEQMAKALRSITVIKAKRCGRTKGRTVADGRPQRSYVPREDSSSPTVGTESLFLSLVIDAYEGRHIVTADIAGAFLHATIDDFVLVRIEGPMVLYLVRANPKKYAAYVEFENGRRVIYLKLKKGIVRMRTKLTFVVEIADKDPNREDGLHAESIRYMRGKQRRRRLSSDCPLVRG